ncbi:MAG TPA: Xaa-Pro peptidase family protein [Candidatus Limnocylindrales bacterium]
MTTARGSAWPEAADFGRPPSAADLERWADADRAARPTRLARIRERLAREGLDAYFGVRGENSRYLTGFELRDGEEKVAGHSGQFLLSGEQLVILADSRYAIQAQAQAPEARPENVYGNFPERWPELVGSLGARRVGVEAGFVSHSLWTRLAEAEPSVELVPVEGWVEEIRAVKEPAELERVAAACGVGDRALATLLPSIRVGRTERDLALELEWLIRTGGAEALAFDPAVLAGPDAALPHGAPGERPVVEGQVLLFDFGAQVAGYRSDMTRTLFVGEPSPHDAEIHELVARAQAAAISGLERAVAEGTPMLGRAADALAREVIEAAGRGERFGHGLGHGIGLATHELPSLSRTAPVDALLPSPTVFSVEPGVYLDGEMGVRIEDLIAFDRQAGRVERLTRFPTEAVILPA